MRAQRYDPWDKRMIRWIDWNWEIVLAFLFIFAIGFCLGALAVMIQHQHQIIALYEQIK